MTDEQMSPKEAIDKLLAGMAQVEASDLHLKVGYAPHYRVQGTLRAARMPALPNSAYIEAMLHDMIPETRREDYRQQGALDFAGSNDAGDRFRINLFKASGNTNASIRRVQSNVPTFEELNLPPIYPDTVRKTHEGLILVSGVTGSGKSSTLAAMVQQINEIRNIHIITIEDPIEFAFKPKKSMISQREIGIDVADYKEALRYVVRQDPDCIMIGEMRDRETMLAGLQAAETGHLVFGSLHVAEAAQTFNRILEFFPRSEHSFIRSSMASSLQAIFCQRLLKGIDEGTRFPAAEVLLKSPTIKDKILNEKDSEIPEAMADGKADGMQTFTDSLCELINADKVHYDEAMDHAPNREALSAAVKGIKAR